MKKTLFLGYGNRDRQDDGVAWHILVQLAEKYNYINMVFEDDIDISVGDTSFFFTLQLYPELSDEIIKYERVIFVDAHTGSIQEDIHMEILDSSYLSSPMTHHMTPNTLLQITKTIHNLLPEAILVSVRGYEFGFIQNLSSQTQSLTENAVNKIYQVAMSQ